MRSTTETLKEIMLMSRDEIEKRFFPPPQYRYPILGLTEYEMFERECMNDQAAEIEKAVESVEADAKFGSPAGDKAVETVNKLFTQLDAYLSAKLPDGFMKPLVLAQLKGVHSLIVAFVLKQLS